MLCLVCSRTFLSIIAGVLAGIIGFTGLTGFVFYFVVMLITSVGLMAKAGFSADLYFDSWNRVLFDGFLGGLMVCHHFLFMVNPQFSPFMCFYQHVKLILITVLFLSFFFFWQSFVLFWTYPFNLNLWWCFYENVKTLILV